MASRAPRPLRAFFQRVRNRRCTQIAIVATAGKMTTLCWHLIHHEQGYAFARPGLVAFKRRKLELAAGEQRAVARRGLGYQYNNKELRREERELVEASERAYAVMVAHSQPRPPKQRTPPAIPGR